MWFNQEKSKLENQTKGNKDDHQSVNLDIVFDDYFENKEDKISKSIMSLVKKK